ncbi:zinc finger protein BRUTUS isoform X1 [Iris pallida]|uniref:Zinc finger protein BRUTUS isoform X1 n=1 Tax=Iris pallida TaxID=29817 RepID=A0AAX6G1S5_IRIPA|nr:zinc finger protein BRUTUS isoform X1 [Iris pallida]
MVGQFYYRMVYHCPFCNLCRLGKGLGVDFFHCMKCNCCLGMKLAEHKCREKGLETNCPICCDFLFTSSAAVRALPCGHFMHSACFQVLLFRFLLFLLRIAHSYTWIISSLRSFYGPLQDMI